MDGGLRGKESWVRKMNRCVDAKWEGPSEWREGSEWPMCVREVARGVSGVSGQGMKRGKGGFLKDVGPVEGFGHYTGAEEALAVSEGQDRLEFGFCGRITLVFVHA